MKKIQYAYFGRKLNIIHPYILLYCYKVLIEIGYITIISKDYNYYGFIYQHSLPKYILSTLLLFYMIFYIPKQKKPIKYYAYILLILIFIPSLSYFALSGQRVDILLYILISYTILIMLFRSNIKLFSIKIKNPKIWLFILFGFYVISQFYIMYKRGFIDKRAFSFNTIYSLRSEDNIEGILGYFINWDTRVLFSFFCVYFLSKKNKTGVLFVMSMQLLAYLSFGNKTFLIAIFATIGIFYLFRFINFIKAFLIGMNTLLMLSYITYLFKSSILINTFLYRMVFIPTLIQYQYFEFFSGKDKLYFAEGMIGNLLQLKSSYPVPIANYISFIYRPNLSTSDTFANTGFISDSYANLGIIGIIIISFLLGLILLLIVKNTLHVDNRIVISSSIVILFNFMDNSFLTTLLTSGLFLLVILLVLLNNINEENCYAKK